MGKQRVLLVIWTVVQLSGSILGLCPGAADQPQYVFVGQDKGCDGNHPFLLPGSPLSPMGSCTKCCKSFLSCLPTGLPSGDGPPFQCVEVAYVFKRKEEEDLSLSLSLSFQMKLILIIFHFISFSFFLTVNIFHVIAHPSCRIDVDHTWLVCHL